VWGWALKIANWLFLASLLPVYSLNAADGVGTLEPLLPGMPAKPAAPVLSSPTTPQSDTPLLSQQSQLFVTHIQLQGNTVFSAEELATITSKYEHRAISAEDLRQLRHELTLFYINNGYINSGAVLPEQNVQNGELRVQIIEGQLTEVTIEGLEHLSEAYLRPRIEKRSKDQPLNLKDLQNDLQLIQQNPLIKRINAVLTPGLRPGEALLRTNIEEANPWYLLLGGNNYGVPSVGAERFETWAGHRDLLGFGDELDGHFNVSAGQTQYDFDYGIPFTRWDSRFKLRYQKSEADVVEKPFDEINIYNELEAFTVGLSQPVWTTPENQATLGLMLERRHSQSFLFEQPFSFSFGSIDGASDVSVVRFSQDWLHRTSSQVLAFRSVASWGVDALGSTIHSEDLTLPDSNFFVWLGQLQWIQLLWDSGVELHWRGDTQISASPLLSLEQFTLGGRYSVRGYRQNQVVRDNGFSSSVEFRIPVLGDGMIKLAPFFDMGRSWNSSSLTAEPPPHNLLSTGIGLLFDFNKQVHAEFYWAHQFSKISNASRDLQDDGINFSVTYSPL
jgi:hemolysin activation/secretion protein